MSVYEQTMPASPLDWANQIAGKADSNALISIAALLDRPLSRDTAIASIRLLLRHYPILTGQFIAAEIPFWQLMPAEPESFYQEIETATTSIPDILTGLINQSDPGNFRLTQVLLPDGQAVLVLSMHHALSDGAGLKHLWQLFLSAANNPSQATAIVPAMAANRMPEQILHALGDPAAWREAAVAGSLRQKAARSLVRPIVAPSVPTLQDTGPYQIYLRHWTREDTAVIRQNYHEASATLTEYLLADILTRLPGRAIQVTVDLRRYLTDPAGTGPANLSGMELAGFPELPERPADRRFAQMLPIVCREFQKIKSQYPGLGSFLMQLELPRLGYAKVEAFLLQAGHDAHLSGMTAPLLSNIGQLAGDESIDGCKIQNVFLLPAGFALPAAMLGISSWNGQLTACLIGKGGICPPALDPANLVAVRIDPEYQITAAGQPLLAAFPE